MSEQNYDRITKKNQSYVIPERLKFTSKFSSVFCVLNFLFLHRDKKYLLR